MYGFQGSRGGGQNLGRDVLYISKKREDNSPSLPGKVPVFVVYVTVMRTITNCPDTRTLEGSRTAPKGRQDVTLLLNSVATPLLREEDNAQGQPSKMAA